MCTQALPLPNLARIHQVQNLLDFVSWSSHRATPHLNFVTWLQITVFTSPSAPASVLSQEGDSGLLYVQCT